MPHADRSHLSFNLALNSDFEGGGTLFPHFNGTHVMLAPGAVLVHSSRVNHAGANVTRGTRYILVGFVNVLLPWYQGLWRQWGTTATMLQLTRAPPDDAPLLIAADSAAAVLAQLFLDSVTTMATSNRPMLVLLVLLLVLLAVLLAMFVAAVLSPEPEPEALDDPDDEPRAPTMRRRQLKKQL